MHSASLTLAHNALHSPSYSGGEVAMWYGGGGGGGGIGAWGEGVTSFLGRGAG